ncbi:MAG: ABC transporter ATP-binding protein [Candidatus Marinamargulisbacteria bacterium]
MINTQSLTKIIPLKHKELCILSDITIDTTDSHINILYGKSGSGKTTLMHLLAGLDVPTTGDCWVDNTQVSSLTTDERARFRLYQVGMVYQFFNLIPNLTLEENIRLPLIMQNKPNQTFDDICDYLGIQTILSQFPNDCSGGELQRASFARAMVTRPAVILADEPTGNLDSHNRERMMALIQSCATDFGTTFFIATHDDAFKSIATQQFTLVDGVITS